MIYDEQYEQNTEKKKFYGKKIQNDLNNCKFRKFKLEKYLETFGQEKYNNSNNEN